MRIQERVIGCFKGLATGDSIAKQTELLSRAEIQRWYPEGVRGFQGQLGAVIPRYLGKRYEWRIGETTDDTEQTLAVTRAILRWGRPTHCAIGEELLKCKKSLHPGVSMWTFVQMGDPHRTAFDGDGCGAAMRVAPVGVLYPSDRLDLLISGAYECALPTHGGQMAVCAAAAVAGAVSAALDGRPTGEVLTVALRASTEAERLRPPGGGATIAASIREIYSDLVTRDHLIPEDLAERYFPNTPQCIVPLAIGLAMVTQSAERTALLAANIGGDSDTVASIGSAIAGALQPDTVNDQWFEAVRLVNPDDLLGLTAQLGRHRSTD